MALGKTLLASNGGHLWDLRVLIYDTYLWILMHMRLEHVGRRGTVALNLRTASATCPWGGAGTSDSST